MSGGMTHLDTFGLNQARKPEGQPSNQDQSDGVQLAENLPLLANHADKIAVIRGMTSTKGAIAKVTISCYQLCRINHRASKYGGLDDQARWSFQPYSPGCVVVNGEVGIPYRAFFLPPINPCRWKP